jgi:Tol biopolymer transport system component
MNHALILRGAASLAALALLPSAAVGQAAQPIGDAAYDSAFFAWERGDYPDALRRLDRLLGGANAARYLEPAAILTGELFTTIELTRDGARPVWSADGRHVAWETGAGAQRMVHVAAIENGRARNVASMRGFSPAIAAGGRLYYLTIADSPELTAARTAVDAATQARNTQAATQARTQVQQLEAAGTRLMMRELASGSESVVPTTGLLVQSVSVRAGDGAVHVLGAPADAGNTSDFYRVGSGAPQKITTATGPKIDPIWLAGDKLYYRINNQSFAIQDLRTGQVTTHRGAQATVSADGSALAFVRQDSTENVISVMRFGAMPSSTDVVRRREQVQAPALSPTGARLAYQSMPREDWELYVVDVAAKTEKRITREIQHDLTPRFLDENRVLALIGEARHRRSYLYDVNTLERTRVFHNNTVRTVVPEYEWTLSPDRTKLLVVADRDGNTVSAERGVYVTDLTRKVNVADVRARVQSQIAAEDALRAKGRGLFQAIEQPVRAAVADVSTDRVYRYSYDLYQFDSKFITQPGNAKAIEYITAKLRAWGYEPEVQTFEARGVTTANVIAKLVGTVHPDVLYTVSSHFDSVERGPGADDDTSGTAALLEAARVLAKRPQPATIHFAFFTGEEAGLLGSREYVRRAVDRGDKLVGALNNDMIGFANDQRLDNTIRYSNDGIRDIQHAAAFLFTNLITYDAKYYRSTDAAAYYEAYGDIVGGIGSYPILGNPHYHQTHDQLETINHQLVAEVSKTTIATLIKLTNVPSRPKNVQLAARTGGNVQLTWEALPEKNITGYAVVVRGANGQQKSSANVSAPSASVAAAAGDTIEVWGRAGTALSWDAARVVVQ